MDRVAQQIQQSRNPSFKVSHIT